MVDVPPSPARVPKHDTQSPRAVLKVSPIKGETTENRSVALSRDGTPCSPPKNHRRALSDKTTGDGALV